MSPTFSSGKLKGMMEPMESVCKEMTDFIREEIINGKCQDRDIKEIFTCESIMGVFILVCI